MKGVEKVALAHLHGHPRPTPERQHWGKKIYCPVCSAGFQGEGADERYRKHYKEAHSVKQNR